MHDSHILLQRDVERDENLLGAGGVSLLLSFFGDGSRYST